jgi:hypothetical protein
MTTFLWWSRARNSDRSSSLSSFLPSVHIIYPHPSAPLVSSPVLLILQRRASHARSPARMVVGEQALPLETRPHHSWEFFGYLHYKGTVFWVVTPCSLDIALPFRGIYHLHAMGERVSQRRNHLFLLIFCLAYFSTVKMVAVCSSETSRPIRTTQRCNSEDRRLHGHRREDPKSNTGPDVVCTAPPTKCMWQCARLLPDEKPVSSSIARFILCCEPHHIWFCNATARTWTLITTGHTNIRKLPRTRTKLVLILWLYSPLLGLGRFSVFLISHTVGRTPLTGDQPVASPLSTHRTTQTQNKCTQTSMPWVGFEPTTPVFERAKAVHVLDRGVTVSSQSYQTAILKLFTHVRQCYFAS